MHTNVMHVRNGSIWYLEILNGPPATQQRYKIRPYSCNHRFVIYVVYCTKCGKYYVGSSLAQLRKRLGQHRCNIEDVANGTYENENDSAAKVYRHFNNECIGDKHIPLFDKNGKQLIDNNGHWAKRTEAPFTLQYEMFYY